jgi:CheY-like chemotaxis protein
MTVIGKKAKSIEDKNLALRKIEDASSHLLGVINDVLDMSKIEANKLELAPINFNIEKMLQKIITINNFRIEEKQQILSVNIDDNVPRFVTGDDQRLAQVITNLLSNAVKFTPEGGNIYLNLSLIGETEGICELRIEVIDSGIGISREQQEKLFTAFGQAESGTSRKYGGTGLGLVISKRIIELMGGNIRLESELGKGARFIFTIKVQCNEKIAENLKKDQKKYQTITEDIFVDKRVLIAEDVEINREIFISLLENTGLLIDCAKNGKEALDIVTENPEKYDIVFMDLQMPQMDGLEAARRIRSFESENNRRQIPIVAMTANVFKDDIEACLEAGMNDHLGKPLDIEKLMEKLHTYLLSS